MGPPYRIPLLYKYFCKGIVKMKIKIKHKHIEFYSKLFGGIGVGVFILGICASMVMALFRASN